MQVSNLCTKYDLARIMITWYSVQSKILDTFLDVVRWFASSNSFLQMKKINKCFNWVFVYTYICASTNRLNFLYIPFSAEAKQLAFISERCTFEAVCFFTVVETLLGRIFFLCEEGTISLVELLAFFVESTAPWLIPRQDQDAKLTMYIESWQKDGFYTHKK